MPVAVAVDLPNRLRGVGMEEVKGEEAAVDTGVVPHLDAVIHGICWTTRGEIVDGPS